MASLPLSGGRTESFLKPGALCNACSREKQRPVNNVEILVPHSHCWMRSSSRPEVINAPATSVSKFEGEFAEPVPSSDLEVQKDNNGRSRGCFLVPTRMIQFWRNFASRWHWDSVYTRLVVILIEAALPPAFCGTTAVILYYGRDYWFWRESGSLGNLLVLRLFLTLWLGTSVRPSSHS